VSFVAVTRAGYDIPVIGAVDWAEWAMVRPKKRKFGNGSRIYGKRETEAKVVKERASDQAHCAMVSTIVKRKPEDFHLFGCGCHKCYSVYRRLDQDFFFGRAEGEYRLGKGFGRMVKTCTLIACRIASTSCCYK
jgi:hypothetical protein